MKQRRQSVTQSDIAKAAKVTQGVVSYVLSGSQTGSLNVSEETRERVARIAKEMGYEPAVSVRKSKQKSGPVSKRMNVLYVKDVSGPTHEDNESIIAAYNSLFGKMIQSFTKYLHQVGMGISIHHLNERQDMMQWLAESDISGVIWQASFQDRELVNWIASRYPFVAFNRFWATSICSDSVRVEQGLNIRLAAEHLWEQGHRRIATFGHVPGSQMFPPRIAAYKAFVEEKGIRNYHEFQAISDEQELPPQKKVFEIIQTWKSLGNDAPTAIILSDVFALRLLDEAPRQGVRIPEDLSVIGVDNTDAAPFVNPALTSMEESFDVMCRSAVELVVRRMKNRDEPSQHVSIGPRLVIRDSVRCLHESDVNEEDSVSSPLLT